MKNRTVVKLLAQLGQRNINSLDSYLHSFYGKQECVRLFDAMKEYAPKFSSKKMHVELIWERCFPSKKLSNNRLDKLCQEMKEDTITREKLYLRAVERYEMREEIEETLEGLVPLIKGERKTEIWTNEALIEVYHQLYFNTDLMRKKDKGKQALIDALENLDTFYLTYRTFLETEKTSRTYIVKEEFPTFNFTEIRDSLKEIQAEGDSSALFQTLEFFLTDNVKNKRETYEILEEQVFDLLPNLQSSDQLTVLNFLLVVANFYAKQGQNEFTPKMFRILKFGVEHNLILLNNSISPMYFANTIEIACKSGETEWAEQFFNDYQTYLRKESQRRIVELSASIIAFAKKDYPKAKEILEEKRFNNQHNMRSRWILTMVYYDAKDDNLRNECEAFAQYLYREKSYNEMNRKGTLNFLKAIDMLLDPNVGKSKILTFMNNCQVISQRIWLDQKLEERKF